MFSSSQRSDFHAPAVLIGCIMKAKWNVLFIYLLFPVFLFVQLLTYDQLLICLIFLRYPPMLPIQAGYT